MEALRTSSQTIMSFSRKPSDCHPAYSQLSSELKLPNTDMMSCAILFNYDPKHAGAGTGARLRVGVGARRRVGAG